MIATPWTVVACQALLFMRFHRQEYWSGLPFPSPGDLPNPEVKPRSLALQAYSLPSEPPGKPKFSQVTERKINLQNPQGVGGMRSIPIHEQHWKRK